MSAGTRAGGADDPRAASGKGAISYEEMEAAVRENTKAVVCTHASNLTGNTIDLERVGAMAKRHGLLFVVDASQTAGVYPIDVEKMQIDVLCFTGHKSLLGSPGDRRDVCQRRRVYPAATLRRERDRYI